MSKICRIQAGRRVLIRQQARAGTRRWSMLALVTLLVAMSYGPALGWNAHGHRIITLLALEGLAQDVPAFLRDPEIALRIADQANEPDRWRATRRAAIAHEANPEHYLNVEDLAPFGLALETLPPLRYEYVRALVLARERHGERLPPYDPARDPDRAREWPGFLPWAIAERFAKLQSAFHTLRVLEQLDDPARVTQLIQARENVIHEIGLLSHYVGDAAQPLHTTRHHHGWVGPNPHRYTTDRGFHAFIDGRILEIHGLDVEVLRPAARVDRQVRADDPWPDILAHIRRSFERVEELYRLEKSGALVQEPGRNFIIERLCDGAGMLAAMVNAAWEASTLREGDIEAFVRFSEWHNVAVPAGR